MGWITMKFHRIRNVYYVKRIRFILYSINRLSYYLNLIRTLVFIFTMNFIWAKVFVSVMNHHLTDLFSSDWWFFISESNFHLNVVFYQKCEFSSHCWVWWSFSCVMIFIQEMNYLVIDIFHQRDQLSSLRQIFM